MKFNYTIELDEGEIHYEADISWFLEDDYAGNTYASVDYVNQRASFSPRGEITLDEETMWQHITSCKELDEQARGELS